MNYQEHDISANLALLNQAWTKDDKIVYLDEIIRLAKEIKRELEGKI